MTKSFYNIYTTNRSRTLLSDILHHMEDEYKNSSFSNIAPNREMNTRTLLPQGHMNYKNSSVSNITMEDRIGNNLMGISTEHSPIDPGVFQAEVDIVVPRVAPHRVRGLTDTLKDLRGTFLRDVFVKDGEWAQNTRFQDRTDIDLMITLSKLLI